MRLRRLAASLCVPLLLVVACWSGCTGGGDGGTSATGSGSSGGAKRIILVTNGPDPFWDTCEAGTKAAEKDFGLVKDGYVVDFQRGDFTEKKQIDMLKQYALAGDVAAVAISVFNPESRNLAEEMKGLQAQGIKVITFDSDISREQFRDARYAYIGTDNVIGGKELGRAAKAINPKAKYAFFVGDVGVANGKERMDGFVTGMGTEATEISRLGDGGDRVKARKNVEDTLDRNPETDMLIGIWAYNSPQIIKVVQDRGIRDKAKVVCFDAAQDTITGMGAGNVDVMIVQNPYQMGYDGVKLMHALVKDDQATIKGMFPTYALKDENDVYRTELRVVVPDKDSPITKDLFDTSTIFFNYSEFMKWMTERGLVSS